MRYYCYRPDANNYAGIGVSMADDDRVTNIHFQDIALASKWRPVVAHGFDDNPETEGDFPSLTNFNEIPVFSQRAWVALCPIISYCCEALPIMHPSGELFYVIHVMETIDCLDEDKSDLRRSAIDGRVNRIFKYSFKPHMMHGKHILKLPLKSGADLIVDDVFRSAVESNDLKGLLFKELPII
jgi:hypothetical protein